MNGRTWLAVALGATAVPAAASTRQIEATANADQLSRLLLPDGVVHEWTVCSGDCPSGVGRVHVSDPAVALSGRAVQTRAKVHVDLAMVGRVEADVSCSVAPELRDGGQVHARGQGCRIERLVGGVPVFLRPTVIATLEPALGVLLDDQLQGGSLFDLLGSAKEGMLAWFTADPAARAPESARCVQAIRSLTVRDGDTPVLVAIVDVGCAG